MLFDDLVNKEWIDYQNIIPEQLVKYFATSGSTDEEVKSKNELMSKASPQEKEMLKELRKILYKCESGDNFLIFEQSEEYRPVFDHMKKSIAEAKKFFLKPDFCSRTASIYNNANTATVVSMSRYCRLPFDNMVLSGRFSFQVGDDPDDVEKVDLIFTLCDATEKDGPYCIAVQCCLVMKGINTKSNYLDISWFVFEPDSIKYDNGNFNFKYGIPSFKKPLSEKEQFLTATMAEIVYDVLVRINQKHMIEEQDNNSLDKLNRARLRTGKPALFEYHIIDLSKDMKERLRSQENNGAHNRLHWRRGHFKNRKTGIFWWDAHMAGSKEIGMIESDYSA